MGEEYITRKRARINGIGGLVNIPFGSVLQSEEGFLFWHGNKICAVTSQNAYDYFSCNSDGKGKERGALVNAITSRLEKRDENYQTRWDKVWQDKLCQKYRRLNHADHWIWNFEFYNAPIADLQCIARLIGTKG